MCNGYSKTVIVVNQIECTLLKLLGTKRDEVKLAIEERSLHDLRRECYNCIIIEG